MTNLNPSAPPLSQLLAWQNYWGLKDRFELKLLGGHSLNPLPSVHSLWLITKHPLVCWLDGIIGDWRTHEIPQLPTHLLWHPKSTVWYPWPIIGPPNKALISKLDKNPVREIFTIHDISVTCWWGVYLTGLRHWYFAHGLKLCEMALIAGHASLI